MTPIERELTELREAIAATLHFAEQADLHNHPGPAVHARKEARKLQEQLTELVLRHPEIDL